MCDSTELNLCQVCNKPAAYWFTWDNSLDWKPRGRCKDHYNILLELTRVQFQNLQYSCREISRDEAEQLYVLYYVLNS